MVAAVHLSADDRPVATTSPGAAPVDTSRVQAEARLEEIAEALCRIAALDFSQSLEVKGDETVLDSVVGTINMLAEELRANIEERTRILLELEDRVRARTAELEASMARYRMLVESTNVVPWELDARANVCYVAPQVAVLFGDPADVFVGNAALWQRTHPDDRDRVLTEIAHLARCGGGHVTLDYRIVRPDGATLDVRSIVSAQRSPAGEDATLRGVTFDVTQQHKLEGELRQAHKLEAVGRLAAGIAHEINTPIQFIGDNLSFVRESLDALLALYARTRGLLVETQVEEARRVEDEADIEYLKDEVPRAISQSLDGIHHVVEILGALKTFAHEERDEAQAPVDLHATLHAVIAMARNETKDVADVILEPADLPPVVAFASGLKQVFLNLIVNAAHAVADVVARTGDRGRITLRTERDGDDVVVSVIDTGTGIPQEIREKVFEHFFTTKDVGQGSGQGLTLARAIVVDNHAGALTFESEPGRGTTFFVRLPIRGKS